MKAWAVLWHSDSRIDGCSRHLIWDRPEPPYFFGLFRTRAECRRFIEEKYGYIRDRPDLQNEPHGWRMPTAVRVTIAVAA